MNTTIVCPHCNKELEVSQALSHQMKQEFEGELTKAREEAKKAQSDELKEALERIAKKDEELEKSRRVEIEIRKQKNELEEEKKAFELEKQRQLDEERKKIVEKTTEQIAEQQRLKDREKDKQIDDLKKLLEDAQRKANQGSQQLQGEVQELDLEETLRQAFPGDVILPIGKGVLGADIAQVVKTPRGNDSGTILWESKRTKAWSDGWVTKLKEDTRNSKANIPVIVSETMPEGIKHGLGTRDGVWVVSPINELIVMLATLLRKSLLDAAKQKVISESKQSRAEEVYEFITSHEFAQQVESMMETYQAMRAGIAHERTVYEKMWKQREMQVTKLLSGVSGIYGSIQGIAGTALPSVKSLLLETES